MRTQRAAFIWARMISKHHPTRPCRKMQSIPCASNRCSQSRPRDGPADHRGTLDTTGYSVEPLTLRRRPAALSFAHPRRVGHTPPTYRYAAPGGVDPSGIHASERACLPTPETRPDDARASPIAAELLMTATQREITALERVDLGSFTQSPSQNRAGTSRFTRLPLSVPRLSHERASEQTTGVAGASLASAMLEPVLFP